MLCLLLLRMLLLLPFPPLLRLLLLLRAAVWRMHALCLRAFLVFFFRFVPELDGVWLAFTETRPAPVSSSSSSRSSSSNRAALGYLLPDLDSNDGTVFVSVETTALVFRPKVGDLISKCMSLSCPYTRAAYTPQQTPRCCRSFRQKTEQPQQHESSSSIKVSSETSKANRELLACTAGPGLPTGVYVQLATCALLCVVQLARPRRCGRLSYGCCGSDTLLRLLAESIWETDFAI